MTDWRAFNGRATSVPCPRCGVGTKLVIRINRFTRKAFLSCPNWPECGHSQPMPEHVSMELAGAERLPGM